jgi:2-C-methyl-D-erythritol 4-phosphate cytidylyltransferase
MIFVGILAGGSGKRMKYSDRPKQFINLQGKPVIIHTIEKFLTIGEVEEIYVGMNKEWVSYFEDLKQKYLPATDVPVITIAGGDSRNETIENILLDIKRRHTIANEDFIITHDAVRPFVSYRIIKENINQMKYYDMVDTAIPVVDTIVESRDGEVITNIPNRNFMYKGQTPQTFLINKYLDFYEEIENEDRKLLTDACKVFVLREEKVGLVEGDETNIKLTTINDLKLANAILEVI